VVIITATGVTITLFNSHRPKPLLSATPKLLNDHREGKDQGEARNSLGS